MSKIWEINRSQLFNQTINWRKISLNGKEKKSFDKKKRWIRTDKNHPQPTKSTASKIKGYSTEIRVRDRITNPSTTKKQHTTSSLN